MAGTTVAILIGMVVAAEGMPGLLSASSANANEKWTEMFIPYNENIDPDSLGPFHPYPIDNPKRQHFHIRQASDGNDISLPSPVFVFAHGNGGNADSLKASDVEHIVATGYSVISWESVTLLTNEINTYVSISDFELFWKFLQTHATTYHLDPNHIIIGGHSRGSVCSWVLAHDIEERGQIRGIYMYNALPDPVWRFGDQSDMFVEAITQFSPPAYLGFGPECPKPIAQDCRMQDIHNPRHGQTIVEAYTDSGIGDKIVLRDGLQAAGIGIYDFFPEFVNYLSRAPSKSPMRAPTKSPMKTPSESSTESSTEAPSVAPSTAPTSRLSTQRPTSRRPTKSPKPTTLRPTSGRPTTRKPTRSPRQ